MKNTSAVFFTENKEANIELTELLKSICNLSICGYSYNEWEDIDFYSSKNTLFVIDSFSDSEDFIWLISKLFNDGIFSEVPLLFTNTEDLYKFENKGFFATVCDVLPASFERDIVFHRIENLFEIHNSKQQIKNITKVHTKRFINQANKLKEQNSKLQSMNFDLVELLVAAIESRDLESGQHIKRIRYFTKALTDIVIENCPEYNITPEYADFIYYASSVHDIGKIAIPDSILLKPGRLTDEEFELMKTHTTRGAKLIDMLVEMNDSSYFKQCREICLYHHEKWDGKGYPYGLKGDEIPISAQIVSVCDCYDALTSVRPYKRALSHDEAVDMILGGSCGAFSPQLMKCFTDALPEFKRIENQFKSKSTKQENKTESLFIKDKTKNVNGFSAEHSGLKYSESEIIHSIGLVFEADLLNDGFKILNGNFNNFFDYTPKNFEELLFNFKNICHPDDVSLFSNRLSLNYFSKAYKNERSKLKIEFRTSDDYENKIISGFLKLSGDNGEISRIFGVFDSYIADDILIESENVKENTDLTSGLKLEQFVKPEIEKFLITEKTSKNLFIFIDIDNMKTVNNHLGYGYGNELIKEFGNKLALIENNKVIVCKPASDKFIVFKKDIKSQTEVILLIETIHNSLKKVYHTPNFSGTFTVSMGISRFPEDGTSYYQLRNAAEYALRITKLNGNNSYMFFNKNMMNFAIFSAESNISECFNSDFTPVFIPVTDIKTGKLQCYDYIPCSDFEDNSFVTPDKFYELNKSYGFSKSVSLLSVQTLLFNLIKYKKSGMKIPPVSVYIIIKPEEINEFVHSLKSFTEEFDCSGIDLCIIFPQDIFETNSKKQIINFFEIFKQTGFSLGLYLIGKKYIHSNCFIPGIFKRFVLTSEYFENESALNYSFDYITETISHLNEFAEIVSIPVKLNENILSKLSNDNSVNLSQSSSSVKGIDNITVC